MIAAPPGIKAQYEAYDPATGTYVDGEKLLEAEVVALTEPVGGIPGQAMILNTDGALEVAMRHLPTRGEAAEQVHFRFVGIVGEAAGARQRKED